MKHLLIIFSAAFLITGCATGPKEQPISDAEAIEYAKKFETSIKTKSTLGLKDLFQEEIFAKRIAEAAGESTNAASLKEIAGAIRKKNFAREIVNNIGEEGDYEFIRHYTKDNKQHLIFRLYGGGLNYHDMEIVKTKGKIQVADMFMYTSGENISETIANSIEALTGVTRGSKKKMEDYAQSISRVKMLIVSQKYKEAKEEYDALPLKLRQEKLFMIMNIQACSELDEETYKKALDEFQAKYKDDAGSQLVLIDSYFLKEDYPKALEAVNIIDKAIGGDVFLEYYRGLIYKQMKETDKALRSLETLHQKMPGFADGTIELIALHLENKNETRAAELVKAYQANDKLDQKKLFTISILYPAFAEKNDIKWTE